MGFSGDLNRFSRRVEATGTTAARKVALAVLQGVTFRSPVDVGHFRRNWRVNVGGPSTGVFGKPGDGDASAQYPATTAEIANADARIRAARWEDPIHVSNPVDYGEYLEDGSSAQTNNRPNGIVGATVDEVEVKFAGLIAEARRGQ